MAVLASVKIGPRSIKVRGKYPYFAWRCDLYQPC